MKYEGFLMTSIFSISRVGIAILQEFRSKMYMTSVKVEKTLKGSLDLIPLPLPSVKIQIMGRKVCFRCKGKTMLGIVNKLLKSKCLVTSHCNVLPYYLK